MHRIEGANCTTDNLFTDGPPATTIPSSWLNSIQEELCSIIDRSGIQLASQGTDTRDQLYGALARLFYPTSGGLTFPIWTTGVDYSSGTVVLHNNTIYICQITHTAGVFETDRVTSGCWFANCPIPVNGIYTQIPIAGSNELATAFPVSQRPAAMFGGTWSLIWDGEASVFQTRDSTLNEGTGVETGMQTRVSGLSADQMEDHYHTKYRLEGYTAGTTYLGQGNPDDGAPYGTTGGTTSTSLYANRAGARTAHKNRNQLLWHRTA